MTNLSIAFTGLNSRDFPDGPRPTTAVGLSDDSITDRESDKSGNRCVRSTHPTLYRPGRVPCFRAFRESMLFAARQAPGATRAASGHMAHAIRESVRADGQITACEQAVAHGTPRRRTGDG